MYSSLAMSYHPLTICLIGTTSGAVSVQESGLHHPSAQRFLHRRFSTTVFSASGNFNRTLGPRVQHPATDFGGTAVVESSFKPLPLSQFRGKHLVLLFHPLDFTCIFPSEIVAFPDRSHEFRSFNTEVVAVSTDSQHTYLAWTTVPRSEGLCGAIGKQNK